MSNGIDLGQTKALLTEVKITPSDIVRRPDWLWAIDREHRFTFFSEQSGAFGYDWGKPIAKRLWDVAADFALDPEKWREHIAVLERREPFRDFVYEVRRTDGSLGIISASGKPVFDAEGEFSGYRSVACDLTDRKRAEQALQRSESYFSGSAAAEPYRQLGMERRDPRDQPLVEGDLPTVRL